MVEFSFHVRLQFRDTQAFIDEERERVHDRLTKRLFDATTDEFVERDRVIVEVEPQ